MIAARSRALASGSGRPIFAATVISRLSFEKSAERFLSCAPFRYMMFLYLECPAMASLLRQPERRAIGVEHRVLLLPGVRLHPPQAHDHPHDLGVVAGGLGLRINVANIVRDALLFLPETFNSLDEQPQLIGRDGTFRHVRESPVFDV